MNNCDPVPEKWTEDELASKSANELRERFSIYACNAPHYESDFNENFRRYNEREAVYVKIFGKLAVIEDARDYLFESKPGDSLVAGNQRLILGVNVMSFSVLGGALIKIASLGDTLRDLRSAKTALSAGKAAVKVGNAQGALLRAQQFGVAQLDKIKWIRTKRLMWGGVAIAVASVSVVFQLRNMKDVENEMRNAIPDYAEWFEKIGDAITSLENGINTMNADINQIVTDTGTGTEAGLLSYLDQAIGALGQFQALVNSWL